MEKLWNKNYLRVMLVNFMMYFAFYLLTPLLPLYLSEQFGASNNMIGVVLFGICGCRNCGKAFQRIRG